MQINFDEIKIPSEKLNQVVSENLETIKIHAQKKETTPFLYRCRCCRSIFYCIFCILYIQPGARL